MGLRCATDRQVRRDRFRSQGGNVKIKIGLITGTIGQGVKQDLWGTLARVQRIGYQGIEIGSGLIAQAQLSPAALQQRLNEVGLQITPRDLPPMESIRARFEDLKRAAEELQETDKGQKS